MNEKIDPLKFIKINFFCFSKDTVKRMKRQSTNWDKTFAKHMSDKEQCMN